MTARRPHIEFDRATHTYRVDGVVWPSVTQILSAFDHELDRVDEDVLNRKAVFGQAVHRACELDDAGILDESSVHPSVMPYLEQWRRFRREMQAEVLGNEHIVVNRLHCYVGTNDRLLRFGRFRRAVCDIKSGMRRPWHEWQTAGYKVAADRYDQPVDGRCCIYLSPTNYKLVVHEDDGDCAVFLSMASVYHAFRKKGVLK